MSRLSDAFAAARAQGRTALICYAMGGDGEFADALTTCDRAVFFRYMVESLAQLGGIAVLLDPRYAGKLPLFGGIDRARFRRQVGPGDTLELHIELGRLSARAGTGTGWAAVGEQRACEASLLFVIADA